MMKTRALTFFLMVGFLSIPGLAQTDSAAPAQLQTCLKPATQQTRGAIYTACQSVLQQARGKSMQLEQAEKMQEKKTGKSVSDAEFQRRLERQKHYNYYMGMAYGRMSELLQSANPIPHASVCWPAGKANYWLPKTYAKAHPEFAPLSAKMKEIGKACAQHPRSQNRDWADIPDSGNLSADIPALGACLGPLQRETFYEKFYQCDAADSDVEGLLVRAHAYADSLKLNHLSNSKPVPKTALAKLYISRAKISARRSQLVQTAEPRNIKDICKFVGSGVYYLSQSNVTPEPGTDDFKLSQGLKGNKTKCGAMGL